MIVRISILLLTGLIFFSCHSSRKVSSSKVSTDSLTVIGNTGSAPVTFNKCRITATIVNILTNDHTTEYEDACDSLPCMAKIRIKSITSIEQGFPANLNEGEEITVHFVFTLMPSGKLFPAMHLQGLNEGDSFSADIEARMMLGGGFNFYIEDYKKIK